MPCLPTRPGRKRGPDRARDHVERRRPREPPARTGPGHRGRGRRRRGSSGGDVTHPAAVAGGAGRERLHRVRDGARWAARDAPRAAARVLTASRHPLVRLPAPAEVPWPERVLCCVADDVEVVNLHLPIAPAPDLAKVRTHEAIAAYLATGSDDRPRILCGDLNTPPVASSPTATSSPSPTTARAGCVPSAANAGTAPSERSSTGFARTGGSMPSAPCTATASARQAGPSHAIAGGGGWTTSWSTGCGRWPAPMRTTGGARASATTRPSSPTSFAERLDAESRRVRCAPSGHTHLRGPTQREDAIHG
jgi:hypothetical protein